MAGGVVSLFFRRGEKRAMTSWSDWGPVAGRTENRATHLPSVYASIRHIVDYGSTLPIDAYRKSSEGSRVQTPLPRLLARQDETGGMGLEQWVGQLLYGMVVHGNSVGWVSQVDGYGYPLDVIWLSRTDWEWSAATKQWHVFGHPVASSNIVHVPWLVPSGQRLGMSPIEHYAAITSAGLSAQEYADMKRGGGLPPLIFKNTAMPIPDPEIATQIGERLAARLAAGQPFVHGKDWDLSAPTIPPNHAQFIETLKLSANQIAAIYGIDPTEIGGQAANSLTYSTEELRQIKRAADMRPYLVRVERAVSRLLPNRQYIQFNIDATMRIDAKTRVQVIGDQIADGRMSVNEARALEDRPPVPSGDFHNVPAPKAAPTTRNEGDAP